MRTLLFLAVMMIASLAACTRGDGKPDSTPEASSMALGGGNFLDLPPVDRSCNRDQDCVFGAAARREGDSCCLGCPSTPVAVSWHRLLLDKCESWNAGKDRLTCTKYQCRERLPVACIDGQCVNK